jgi:hypothetical protein
MSILGTIIKDIVVLHIAITPLFTGVQSVTPRFICFTTINSCTEPQFKMFNINCSNLFPVCKDPGMPKIKILLTYIRIHPPPPPKTNFSSCFNN